MDEPAARITLQALEAAAMGHHLPMDLRFDLGATIKLVEHALGAPAHLSARQSRRAVTAKPALQWVKADGTYLTSNGVSWSIHAWPAPLVLYASGWGPGTGQDLAETVIGGDDFVEHIIVSDASLLQMQASAAAGRQWFVLHVDQDSMQPRIE